MRYISLFSGIEAATVAWEPLGWEPVAFSEIDPFPCAVLAERFPDVPNLGDITDIDWKEVKDKYGSVDLVVGGSPCQSFSVAGKREGLAGASGLMFEYIRAVREILPRYFLWENVPGALSSEGGGAFKQLLGEMDDIGYGLAWRVLDAQFFGVPQRRRRVFLVGCIGNAERAAEILFEPESLRWDTPSSREEREIITACAGRGASASCIQGSMIGRTDENGPQGSGINDDVAFTLNTTDRHAVCAGFKFHQGAQAGNIGYENEQSPTLTADWHNPAVISFAQNTRDEVRVYNGDGQIAGALAANPGMKQQTYICMSDDTQNAAVDEELSGSLKVGGGQPFIAIASSALSAPVTAREPGASTSTRES